MSVARVPSLFISNSNTPRLSDLLDLRGKGDMRTREEVEARFQRLASWALGYTVVLDDTIEDPTATAMLVILRECLHHLGYEAVERIN